MDSSHSQHSGANVPWTPPSPEELAASLPAYEVVEILGRGGMGAVYKARQRSLKRWVAIKLLPLVGADDELKFAERFRNEAETMAQMNHPSIVNVYDFGETPDGLLYIVMEFVDGTDVHKMIHGSGMLSGDYALAITAHVCDALAYAHARGVIHRDIKPANILIDQEGNVKVADFGLAKMTDIDYGLTQSNVAMGTPDYVAPEVLSYGMVADHRADLYAIGVMLYQMLTGEVPRGLFKMPSQKGIGSDPRFDDIICKAMEPDREDRYQSATDVRQALDVILTTALPKKEESGESESAAKSVRFQYAPPQRNAEVVDEGTRSPAKAPPKRQPAGGADRGARTPVRKASSAGLWLGIGGIVAVLGLGAFIGFGSKVKTTAGSASRNISVPTPSTKLPPVKLPAAPSATAVTSTLPRDQWIKLPTTVEEFTRMGYKGVESKDGWLLLTDRFDILKAAGETGDTKALNLAFRATIRPSQTKLTMSFELRYQANGEVYNLEFIRPNRLVVRTTTKDAATGKNVVTTLSDSPITAQPSGDGVYKIEWSIQGDLITVSVDGKTASELRDQTFAGAGRFFFNDNKAAPDAGFKDAYIKILPDAPATTAAPGGKVSEITGTGKVDADAVVPGNKEVSKQESWIDWLATETWKEPWVFQNDTLKPTAKNQARILGNNGDGSVRMRFRNDAASRMQGSNPPLQIMVRSTVDNVSADPRGTYQFQLDPFQGSSNLLYLSKDPRDDSSLPPIILWEGKKFPMTGNESELEFRAEGADLSLLSGGVLIAGIKDDRLAAGSWAIAVSPGIVVTGLETRFPNADEVATTLPLFTHWQDVTETLRETARTVPGLIVGAETMGHAAEGGPTALPISREPLHDGAIRLTHTGDGQVSLRHASGGLLYILCQRTQTIFQHLDKNAATPVKLTPDVPHPASYEHAASHELLVTSQGPLIRAWLDGRFLGEVRDESLAKGVPEIVISKYGEVQKVEIAELETSPSVTSADWQPLFTKPEDFGAHAAKVEFRDGWLFVNTAKTHFPPSDSINGAIRATLRYDAVDSGNLTVRANDGADWGKEAYACSVFITPGGKMATLMVTMKKNDAEKPWKRHDFPLPEALQAGEIFTLEMRVEKGQIAVIVNGKEVGAIPETFEKTKRRFGIMPSSTRTTEFRDVAWQKLE